MSWRPKEGWKNPYTSPHWNDDGEVSGREADIYEEGADAILEAIRKNGYITNEALRKVPGAPGWKYLKDGKWYYIPEEEVK